ncbi:ABC-type Fe3+/spermidine/putrescine transport system ATPase subunit [Desmospora profundinema]|uniref:ABC-type Fe3+/spermidine/putrescine transport system ATPase subunit n=1 Tax=Desmospora profundinema TaxID=1571184 RepID=A0ABU1IKE4_9BACL|nr:ABC-type Fe3+/spermidine/putrescine transport system ATPase subunit [Desmospora profundinema]
MSVRKLTKIFDKDPILQDLDLEVKEGEFFALLGPSGCGKTTTMRCVAGFEEPTEGTIWIGGRQMNGIPAHRRDCGMVFQSYALFPHMTVFDNVAYSLQVRQFYRQGWVRKWRVLARLLHPRLGNVSPEVEQKVMDSLALVELTDLADRLPGQLSGGQQQRVALARAVIMEPKLLLMDEPLSNLDKRLRQSMRRMIRDIQRKLKITTLFVTHDQEEAMSMADRIAVLSEGRLMQVDIPTALYSRPANPFVADFVGSSNLFPGEVLSREEHGSWLTLGNGLHLFTSHPAPGEAVDVLIRPESMTLLPGDGEAEPGGNRLKGRVERGTYLGPNVRYDIRVGEKRLLVDIPYKRGQPLLSEGTAVTLLVEPDRVVVL